MVMVSGRTIINPNIKTISRQYYLVNPPIEFKSNTQYIDMAFNTLSPQVVATA